MLTFNSDIQDYLRIFIDETRLDKYLIYGSCAYSAHTKLDIPISDIDIIVPKEVFPKIITSISTNPKYTVHPFDKTIHINSTQILGNDGNPFDISCDSYEDYFTSFNIDLDSYDVDIFRKTKLKVIKKEDLIKIYARSSSNQDITLKLLEK